MIMSEEAYRKYPHHLENSEDCIDISWVGEIKERVRCKAAFYNSCGIFKKLLFVLLHGRNFVPTQNERRIAELTGSEGQHGE